MTEFTLEPPRNALELKGKTAENRACNLARKTFFLLEQIGAVFPGFGLPLFAFT